MSALSVLQDLKDQAKQGIRQQTTQEAIGDDGGFDWIHANLPKEFVNEVLMSCETVITNWLDKNAPREIFELMSNSICLRGELDCQDDPQSIERGSLIREYLPRTLIYLYKAGGRLDGPQD